MHERAVLLATHDLHQHAGSAHVEHAQRHAVIPAQADGREIHHAEITCDHLVVGQALEPRGRGITLRIGSHVNESESFVDS